MKPTPAPNISRSIPAKSALGRSTKIKELGAALTASGLFTLDEQARALGLSRSTAWAVLKANHKASGLTAATISRMLSSPELPTHVRATILMYVEEKLAGLYGHNKAQLSRFKAGLSSPNRGHLFGSSWWPPFHRRCASKPNRPMAPHYMGARPTSKIGGKHHGQV
jgi:hypothetical protein